MTVPGITDTTLDGQLGALPPNSATPFVVIGPAKLGPKLVPAAFARKQYFPANYGAGPAVELAANAVDETSVPCIFIRTGNSVAGSAGAAVSAADGTCSVPVKTGTGTFTPTIDAAPAPTPNAAYNVRVIFPVGGTLGTGGIIYQVSTNGGTSYGMAQALGTAREIDLTSYIGAVTLILGTGTETIVANDRADFTTTAPVLASAGTLDQSQITGGCVVTISSGEINSVTKHGTGTFTPTAVAGPKPNGVYSGRILFTHGGTIGPASGIQYKLSDDDGVTYGTVQELGAGTAIDLEAIIGNGSISLGSGTVVLGDYVTFTTVGTPCDDFDVKIRIVAGGTVGASSTITYEESLDGGVNYGATKALGSATSITPEDAGGWHFDLAGASPTLNAGDYWTCTTTAPCWNATELGQGFDALASCKIAWEGIIVVGPVTGATFDVIEAKMAAMDTTSPKQAICHWRMPVAGEVTFADGVMDDSVYQAAFVAAMGSRSSAFGKVWVGGCDCNAVSAVSSRSYRRPNIWAWAAKALTVSAEIDIAAVPDFVRPGISIRDDNGNPRNHDEALTPGLDDARMCVLRTWDEFEGVYVNRPRTFCPSGSDFVLQPRRRVFALGRRILRGYLLRVLSRGVPCNPKTGYILESVARNWERGAEKEIWGVLGSTPMASEVSVHISRTDNLLPDGAVMHVEYRMTPLIYVEQIAITSAMRNPAIGG